MPGFDRTGPAGMGPMTGWGRGRCTSYGRRAGRTGLGPSFRWGGRGRGWHRNRLPSGLPGWGRDWFRGPYYEPPYAREDEIAVLREEAAWLKEELNAIEQRLSEFEAGAVKGDQ